MNKYETGQYGAEVAKSEFVRHGFCICASKLNEKGLGFSAKRTDKEYEIKVSTRNSLDYVFFPKEKMPLREDVFVMLVLLKEEGRETNSYLIPSIVWKNPNGVFKNGNYDEKGLKTKPEWGINVSEKNFPEIEQYHFDKMISTMI